MIRVSPTFSSGAVGFSLMLFAAGCSSSPSPTNPSQVGAATLDGGDAPVTIGRGPRVIGPIARATSTPTFVDGNPSCAGPQQSLGYDFAFKPQPEPPPSGTYTSPDGYLTVTIVSDGTTFSWTSNHGVDAVIAKGGPNANVYVYDPPAESTGDSGLVPPINTNNDKGSPFTISHIDFCYDIELEVTKTAATTYTRDYDWTLVKSADQTTLNLSSNESFVVNYEIVVTKDTGTDGDFAVSGKIDVHNPAPFAATGVSVTDTISGVGDVTVTCPANTIAGGATMTCTYSSSLPNKDSRTNTATATPANSNLNAGTGTASVTFGDPTTVIDNSVSISDNYSGGPQGQTIGASQTFKYSRTIDATELACGEQTIVNIATLASDDGASETDDHTLTVTRDCQTLGGCTLTQGYWKTHSQRGPAPYDETWALLGALQENTIFYNSTRTYHAVLWTAPAGNAYYNLAHQFIAARLNALAGADTSSIAAALAAAEALFTNATYTPAYVAGLKGNNAIRQQFVSLASALDAFNNGITGPGHCSE